MTSHDQPTTHVSNPGELRASDLEREAVAARVRDAATEGRLTIAEADDRQQRAYSARTRDDLTPLTADLPGPEPDRVTRASGPLTAPARRRLTVHAALVAVLAAVVLTRWALDPAPWFWPAWPLFWLALSLVVHYRRAARQDDDGQAGRWSARAASAG